MALTVGTYKKSEKNFKRKIKHFEVKVRKERKSVASFYLGWITKRKRSGRGAHLLENVEFPVPRWIFSTPCRQFHLLILTHIPTLVSSWCLRAVQNYLIITSHTGVDVSLLKEEFSISLLTRLIKLSKLNKSLENKANIPKPTL